MNAVLFTINLKPLARFYEQVVGMQRHTSGDDHVVLEKDAFRLVVHQIPEQYARAIVIGTPPKVREASAIKLCFPVKSISGSREIAASLGGCVYPPDREWDYEGTTVCDGWDPDGNPFQLLQAIAGDMPHAAGDDARA